MENINWKSFEEDNKETWPSDGDYFVIVNEWDSNLQIVRAHWTNDGHGWGSWEIKEQQHKIGTVESCCPLAFVVAYTPYDDKEFPTDLPEFNLYHHKYERTDERWYNVHQCTKMEHRYRAPYYPYFVSLPENEIKKCEESEKKKPVDLPPSPYKNPSSILSMSKDEMEDYILEISIYHEKLSKYIENSRKKKAIRFPEYNPSSENNQEP